MFLNVTFQIKQRIFSYKARWKEQKVGRLKTGRNAKGKNWTSFVQIWKKFIFIANKLKG